MDGVIDEIIADTESRPLAAPTLREAALPRLPGKVDAIVGVRRAGKTWMVYQAMRELIASGRPRESLLYFSFEDERIWPFEARDLHRVIDVFYRRHPEQRAAECAYFFDEIQLVPGWERFVRRLVDSERAHICVTGSSSKLLGREIATSLRGRALCTEVFPFSFPEALRHAGVNVERGVRPGGAERSTVENRLRAYLLEGGFPEVQGLDADLRRRVLREYLDVAILRDLIERHDISNPTALRHLVRHLLNATASLFSVNKFYGDLRSRGVPVAKSTLHDFLSFLDDAYLIFPVSIYSESERVRQSNPRKIYAVDTGLVHATAHRARPDWGHLLENLVFLDLRRRGLDVAYYRTKRGGEVDFVVSRDHGRPALVQACADLDAPSTRRREIESLTTAMTELGLREGTIVTLHDEETVETAAGRIEIVPAWLWTLRQTLAPSAGDR